MGTLVTKAKDYYLTAVDWLADHPHVAFWSIAGVAVLGVWF